MVNITFTRRLNANTLHQQFLAQSVACGLPAKGLDKAFAARISVSPSMWSQIKTARPIGDKLARQIESHCGVESGWLDVEHVVQPTVASQSEERFIALARDAWRSANAKGKRELRTLVLSRIQMAASDDH